MIKKFGQQIELIVKDENDRVVMAPSGQNSDIDLRVDFDLHYINGFNRGSVKIWNLNPDMVREVNTGDRYITLNVRLHDGVWHNLAKDWYVSNAMEELILPNSVTTLFCFDSLRKNLFEKVVDIRIRRPSLKNIIDTVVASIPEYDATLVEYLHFPDSVLNSVPVGRASRKWTGSVDGCLQHHSRTHRFNYFNVQDKLVLMYRPVLDNVDDTTLSSAKPDLVLDTDNMRSNPSIGVAQLQVSSNLDPFIFPTAVLDVTELLTAGTSVEKKGLNITDEFLKKSVGGYAKYQTLAVQHRGSNYTGSWETTANAVSPDKGTSMPTVNWFR